MTLPTTGKASVFLCCTVSPSAKSQYLSTGTLHNHPKLILGTDLTGEDMGSEAKTEPWSTPRLPLLSIQRSHGLVQSPERSGTLSPPLYTSASVPFRWEEEPGKPRHCATPSNTVDSSLKCLEPPPRLLLDAYIAKQPSPSPSTVLDGPYMGRSSRFQSFSFRIIRRERQGSFRRCCSSPERSQLDATVFNKKGVFGSWRWGTRALKGKREVVGGSSHVFPSLVDREADNEEEENNSSKFLKFTKTKRPGSFSAVSHAKPPFWATIYEGLKQVVPWKKGRKGKKDGFVI